MKFNSLDQQLTVERLMAEELSYFPDPRWADREGVVLVSDELSTDILLEAYSFGIFPWPHPSYPILWFSPDPRGVLDFSEFHIGRSLKKAMSRDNYEITYNRCFSRVIEVCARTPRSQEEGTWITDPMIRAYKRFHEEGYAHSVECWMDGELVGGIYGVYVANVFSGESMFHLKPNASKYCLVHLVEKLKSMGGQWMDIQMVTENLKAFGGKSISRKDYITRLEAAKRSLKKN